MSVKILRYLFSSQENTSFPYFHVLTEKNKWYRNTLRAPFDGPQNSAPWCLGIDSAYLFHTKIVPQGHWYSTPFNLFCSKNSVLFSRASFSPFFAAKTVTFFPRGYHFQLSLGKWCPKATAWDNGALLIRHNSSYMSVIHELLTWVIHRVIHELSVSYMVIQ